MENIDVLDTFDTVSTTLFHLGALFIPLFNLSVYIVHNSKVGT